MLKHNTCPSGTSPYTVRTGDTFYAIARAHNISLDSLIAANPNVNPDRLSIGQVICIPGGAGPQPPPGTACPILAVGSRGPSVTHLQQLLRDAGYSPGAIDGIFGSKTQSAVMAFQRDSHIAVDGIVGIRTWTALGVNCSTGPQPPSHTCPGGSQPYTIQAGDTIYLLAIRFHTSVDAIMRLNPGINPNALMIGQVICIPR